MQTASAAVTGMSPDSPLAITTEAQRTPSRSPSATPSSSPEPELANPSRRLLLAPDEQRVLDLYDRLQALRLELALAREYLAYEPSPDAATGAAASKISAGGAAAAAAVPEHHMADDDNDNDSDSDDADATRSEAANALKAAQDKLLESRARYMLVRNVVESVMMAGPIVKAVHSGSNTSPIEGCVFFFGGVLERAGCHITC